VRTAAARFAVALGAACDQRPPPDGQWRPPRAQLKIRIGMGTPSSHDSR
jgi:hypothetical protein